MRRLIPSVPLIAVLLSILLHGAILVPAIGLFEADPPEQGESTEQGGIELLPVEMVGQEAPDQPAEHQAEARPPTEPQSAEPQSAEPQAEPQAAEPQAAEPTEFQSPDIQQAEAEPQPPPPAPPQKTVDLTFSLSGTDSASNAMVTGPNVIPASPDDRTRNRPPIYPSEAARYGQQGTVVVLIHVSPMGLAAGAAIMRGSGYPMLDKAALDAVLTWRFRPAIRDGRAIAFDMPMEFVFSSR